MTRFATRRPEGGRRLVALVQALVIAVALAALDLSPGARAAAGAESYRIGAGDLLRIAVYNDANLSGDFRVGPEGSISYPIVGTVRVEDLTPDEIAQQLATRLSGQIPISGAPTVQVVEYALVYVVGDVVKPGPYQFQPNMIALQLVSLAGGLRLPPDVGSKVLQLITAEQQLNDARLLRTSLLVQRARLVAEIEGATFDGTILADQFTDAELRSLIANEVKLFQVRRDVFASQKKILEDQRDSYDQEIASLNEGIRLHDEELTLVEKQSETTDALIARGHTTQASLIERRRELAETKRGGLELRSFLARARQRQLEVHQKLLELSAIWKRQNAEDLREIDLALIRAVRSVSTNVTILDQLRIEMNRSRGTPPSQTPVYTVIRQVNGERWSAPSDELAKVQPGDILRVDSGATVPDLRLTANLHPPDH